MRFVWAGATVDALGGGGGGGGGGICCNGIVGLGAIGDTVETGKVEGGGGGGAPLSDSWMNNAICGIVSAVESVILAWRSAKTRGRVPVAKNKLSSSLLVWR